MLFEGTLFRSVSREVAKENHFLGPFFGHAHTHMHQVHQSFVKIEFSVGRA